MREEKIMCNYLQSTYIQVHHEWDLSHPLNTKLSAIPDFKGVVLNKKRKNLTYLYFFPIFVILLIILTGYSGWKYNVDVLIHPYDFWGDFCGTL